MKVWIDPRRCQATGYCVRIAPAIFHPAADGGSTQAIAEAVPQELRELAFEAEGTCPTNAILVEEEREGVPEG